MLISKTIFRPSCVTTALFLLLTMQATITFAQHPREWQSSSGTSVVAQLVSQTADKVQLIDQNGKAYSLAQSKLSELDRRYLKLQEILQSDLRQLEAVVKHIETIKKTPQPMIEIMSKLAKDYPNSPYASLWAGVATAVALNDTDRAIIHFRDASRRIREQQKIDPNRHRRTLISCHINQAVCFMKKKDAESACEEFVLAFELAKEPPSVLCHNGNQLAELTREGLGLKVPPVLRNKLVAALVKAATQPAKAELQTGWFFSLDLEPAESLEAELSLIGDEPPGSDLKLIATGTGVVCATDHVLTVAKAVTHPYYQPSMITVAIPNAEGGWKLVPIDKCLMGDGKSELAMLRIDNLALTPVTFHESSESSNSEVRILGFERGPAILKAGMKINKGSMQPSDTKSLFFQTTASFDVGNRGGACIDSDWRVVGICWRRSTDVGIESECFSLSGIREWVHSNAPSIKLDVTTEDSSKDQRENLRKGVVPILAWHKNPAPPSEEFGAIRDDWCIACRGKSVVPCRACGGTGTIQTGTTKVRAAYNPINNTFNYIEVPTKAACNVCTGKGKVRCAFCENGKLPGGIGTGKR